MSKEYRTFEEWWENNGAQVRDSKTQSLIYRAWHARDAELSAILGQFEALAKHWYLLAVDCGDSHTEIDYQNHADEIMALIASVKKERGQL